MKQSLVKKILSLSVCLALAGASLAGTVSAAASDAQPVSFIEKMNGRFQEPGMDYRPEARWWLAEGSHTDETLIESIHELYDNGFGAVEFVTLDESAYLDDARYAWGSEEWIHDSHVIMEECNKLGMGVSFTSGTHWATANLTVITPDDEAASQELSYKTVELGAGESFSGTLPTPQLPENVTKLKFVKLIAAQRSEPGSNALVEDSLTDISDRVVTNADGSLSVDYTAPAEGETILFGFWQHGTGEYSKPAATGKSYTINYFSREGADALIRYWNENVLTDEMKRLIQENGDVSMYMDSLELRTQGKDSTKNLWCADYLDEFEARCGYDATNYLPILIMSSGGGFGSVPSYPYTLAGREEECGGIRSDLFQVNTELYMEECLDVLTEWLHGEGITLRAENSYGQLLEISQPIKSLDYVESESLEFGVELDSYRSQAGGAHLYDKLFSSETGAILGENYSRNNNYFRQMFYSQFAAGIQRTVVHGYSSAFGPEQNVQWPGYEGMGVVFSERFNKRQPNTVDYPALMQHVARTQKVLRQGSPQMDVGILRTDYNFNNGIWNGDIADSAFHQQSGYYWNDMTLQNAGYTYDYFSPYLLQDGDISYADGLVQPDGVGYQALVIYQEEMPLESAQVLLKWAQDGLPLVIVEGETTEIIAGKNSAHKVNRGGAVTTGRNDGNDENLAAVMAQIKALGNVASVGTQAQAYDALIGLGVHPRAEYLENDQKNLLSVLRKDEDASYLYVYNYMYENPENYAGQISVEGIYQPYLLNTWSGETEEIADFSYRGGRTVLNVDLAPGEVMVFALDPNDRAEASILSASNVARAVVQDGATTLIVPESGGVSVAFDNGTTFESDAAVPDDIELTGWDLTVQSWEPGEKILRTEDRGLGYTTTEATYATNKVDIPVGSTELVPWKELEAVGAEVSGVGTYTTAFTLPEDWDAGTNRLDFCADSFCGGTAALLVNGTQVAINMDSRTADISSAVKPGENTIAVRVTSSLRNRMIVQGYTGWMGAKSPDDYGMTGETVLKTSVRVPVVPEQTDKTILDRVIAYAQQQKEDSSFENVIGSVQESFTASLENACAVSANVAAGQDEVDAAWKELMNEIHKLGFVKGDKTTLGQLIELAKGFRGQIDSYTPATAEPFEAQLTAAQSVWKDNDAMQQEVADTEAALLEAMMGLRFRADKSVLESVLARASDIDPAAYTAQSVTVFNAANDEAERVNDNPNATQAEVDTAIDALNNAIGGLVAVDTAAAGTAVNRDTALTAGSGSAKTGEATPIALAFFLATLAGSGLFFYKKKK